MTLISGFSNQLITLERITGRNAYGESTYADPVQIRARYEPASGLKRSATGQDVEVESYVLTEAEIALGDLIEGFEVRRIEPIVGKSGTTLGYEAYL